ncbi:hypothetical protein [Bacillus sp. 1P06AnD]|uniref:hypothetical protein n=1 Tax=Bacillus sp. 1P06AnD TaxID=3132208 RepID=UPI00399F02CF
MMSCSKRINPTKAECLDMLIDQYGSNVKKLAYIYIKDWRAAEEVTKEVFISCYGVLDVNYGETLQKQWLLRETTALCKHVSKMRWYKFRNAAQYVSSLFIKHSEQAHGSEMGLLPLYVLSLPVKYREITFLFYYEKLTIAEIQYITDLDPKAVTSRLHYAEKKIARKLGGFISDQS